MLDAYSTLASGGTHHTAHIVATVNDSKKNVVFSADTKGVQVFAPDVMADVAFAMQQVVQDKHGTAHQWISPLERPIAGKTGTQQEQKSAWFIGFTPNVVTEVSLSQQVHEEPHAGTVTIDYVSKLASKKQGVTGGSVPAFLWQSYMKNVFAMPAYSTVVEFPERANVGAKTKPTAAPEESTTAPAPVETQQAPTQTAVPSGLEGKLEADATASVANVGLAPSITAESSDTVTAGRVIRVEPGGGTMLDNSGTVTLVISTGPKVVATPTPTPPPPVVPVVPVAPAAP
jgi:membrane peptidoglycan carboxypeptidase